MTPTLDFVFIAILENEITWKEEKEMGLMDKMMDKMIGRMRPEEKEKMMLKMMPMMMEDVNMTELMVKMMPEMLKNMNALDIFNILKNALPNLPKLIKFIKENMPEAMKERLPKMAKEIMPMACHRVMPTMMEGLTMDNVMPYMMKEMMPDCLWHLLPKMPNKTRVDFISNMTGILVQQGSVEMSDKEKEVLMAKITEKVKV
jgi:hypothetical protein